VRERRRPGLASLGYEARVRVVKVQKVFTVILYQKYNFLAIFNEHNIYFVRVHPLKRCLRREDRPAG
jgi:hypothetical protein